MAIGGGRLRDTEPIDREIVRLSAKRAPSVLFIPTASSDSEKYRKQFYDAYGDRLGCTVDELLLLGSVPDPQLVKKKIDSADIIYVGGGNTLKMMRRWRLFGVDRQLHKAYARGAVLCGVSAGAICWFDRGHSDSMSFYDRPKWNYIAVTGLGLVNGLVCPHYNGRTQGRYRRKDFHSMMLKKGGHGLGIDNHCAVVFSRGEFRVIATKKTVGAYSVDVRRGELVERKLPVATEFAPVSLLRGL